ncbi:Eukaryotic cytochrome b561 [Gracilaria domingensis]|nr:Eukaryotic cytochrome b561 [Gracilaria domingensis]
MAHTANSRAAWGLLAASYATWILTLLWTLLALGGLGTSGSRLFNWHPVLASGAVLAVLTPGVLVRPARRANDGTRDWRVKAVHGFCLVVAFVVLSVAISVAYSSHVQQNKPNLYSLHSWLGIGTVFLMKGNIMAGLASSVFVRLRGVRLLGTSHRLAGVLACLMAFVSATAGFAEMQMKLAQVAESVWQFKVVVAGIMGAVTMCVGVALIALLMSRELDRRFEERDVCEVVRKRVSEELSISEAGLGGI